VITAGVDDVPPIESAGVLADRGHQRPEVIAGADDESELFAGVERQADRSQVELDVDDLARGEFLHAVEAVSGHVIGRPFLVEMTRRDAQPSVGALLPQDGRTVVGEVVVHGALVDASIDDQRGQDRRSVEGVLGSP